MPVAAYLRASTEKQDTSIPAQRKAVEKYAREHGYQIVRWYVDDGISGDSTEKRTGFRRMIGDASSGAFRVVLCWDQDRFGRFDPIEGGYWIKPLRDAGVRLETIAQGVIDWSDFAGRIVWSVQQEAKHAFLRDLSRNVLRGQIDKAKQGKIRLGATPFGYDKIDGELVPNADAATVRRIFAAVIAGEGLRPIAKSLGITPRGKLWSATAVKSIVGNPAYKGTYTFGRAKCGKYHQFADGEISTPGRRQVGSGDAIVIEGAHEPIVDASTWEDAQRRLAANKRSTAPRKTFLLSGLVICGHCGERTHGTTALGIKYYRCSNIYRRCRTYTIRDDVIVPIVLQKLQAEFGTPEQRRKIRGDYEAKLRQSRDALDLKAERNRLASLNAKIEAAATRLLEVDSTLLAVAEKQARKLIADRDAIAARIRDAESASRAAESSFSERVARMEEWARRLESHATASPAELRRLFRETVESLTVHWETGGSDRLARHKVTRIRCVFVGGRLSDL